MTPKRFNVIDNSPGSMQRTTHEDLINADQAQIQMQLIDIDAQVAKLRIKVNSTSNLRDRAIFKDEIDRLLIKRHNIEDIVSNSQNFHEDIEIELIDLEAQIEKLQVRIKHINDTTERKLYLDEIDKLQNKRNTVKELINNLKMANSSNHHGDNFKGNLENAWNDLKVSLFNFKSKF